MKEYDISLGNALMIAVWYCPLLLILTFILFCLIPFIVLYARADPEGVANFIKRVETWLDRKNEEVEAAIKRLSRKS